MAPDMLGKGLLLKADSIADTFCDEIKRSLAQRSRPPRLVGILSTSVAPSKFYAEFTRKQCLSLGFDFVLKCIGAAANPEFAEGDGVEEAIIEANEDENVDGIMVSRSYGRRRALNRRVPQVYYPIFGVQQVCINYTL